MSDIIRQSRVAQKVLDMFNGSEMDLTFVKEIVNSTAEAKAEKINSLNELIKAILTQDTILPEGDALGQTFAVSADAVRNILAAA